MELGVDSMVWSNVMLYECLASLSRKIKTKALWRLVMSDINVDRHTYPTNFYLPKRNLVLFWGEGAWHSLRVLKQYQGVLRR